MRYLNAQNPVSAHPLNRKIVYWYLARQDLMKSGYSSRRWMDLIRNRTGTITNAVWTGAIGRPGGVGSLVFDGTGDYVSCGSDAASQLTYTGYTITALIRPTAAGSYPPIVARSNARSETPSFWSFYLLSNTNKLSLTHNGVVRTSALVTTNDAWNWVAVSSSAGGVLFVLNASSESLSAFATDPTYSTEQLYLGTWGDGGVVSPYQGYLDSIRIYNRSMTYAELQMLRRDDLMGNPLTLNWIRRGPPKPAAAAAGGGFRSRIAGGLVVTAH